MQNRQTIPNPSYECMKCGKRKQGSMNYERAKLYLCEDCKKIQIEDNKNKPKGKVSSSRKG